MENTDIKIHNSLSTDGLHKSAIIYRDDSARFIYVCFRCNRMFSEISETLQHIESHFQLANVVLDQFTEEYKEDNFVDCFAITSAPETVDIKIEILDNNDINDSSVPTRSDSMKLDWSNEAAETIDLVEHDGMKENTKGIGSSEKLSTTTRSRMEPSSKRVYARPYRCHKCTQTCRSMNTLRNHMKTHTDDELLEVYRCKECDCYYKNAYALRVHVLGVHLMTNRFSCNACATQFNFSQNKQFEEHLQLHNGPDKKLWADIKDGIYHRKTDYSKYEELDSYTEQQYPCEFCTQRFYLKCNLDVHTKSVHSGQRRMQCGQCSSIFTTPKVFILHQKNSSVNFLSASETPM